MSGKPMNGEIIFGDFVGTARELSALSDLTDGSRPSLQIQPDTFNQKTNANP